MKKKEKLSLSFKTDEKKKPEQKHNPALHYVRAYTISTCISLHFPTEIGPESIVVRKELWRYDPKVDHSIDVHGSDRICCGVVNRGVALYEGKVLVPVIDGRLVALDMSTGKELWSILVVPKESISHTLTIAPRVVKGKVVGTAGGEFPPFRGYFAAYDVKNGKELWRFYTVPTR